MRLIVRLVIASFVLAAISACHREAQTSTPPNIVRLEREVALKLAYVRDRGPIDPAARQRLAAAHDADIEAEQEISARNFNAAETNLLKAQSLLREIRVDPNGD